MLKFILKITLWPLMPSNKLKVAPGQKRLRTTDLHRPKTMGGDLGSSLGDDGKNVSDQLSE